MALHRKLKSIMLVAYTFSIAITMMSVTHGV
jgi:hypothetical protein